MEDINILPNPNELPPNQDEAVIPDSDGYSLKMVTQTDLIETLVLCTILICTSAFLFFKNRFWVTIHLPKPNRILFLLAHPDDEVMFFGPVLINMVRLLKEHVYILCLSNGNYEGKGSLRKKELWSSCKKLGVCQSNITMLKFDELRDSPDETWSIDLLARIIDNHVVSHDIDTVITFDEFGVSGHTNHIACYKAVHKLLAQRQFPRNVRVFLLESINVIRKYCSSVFDCAVSGYTSDYMYVVNWKQRRSIMEGMRCHESQLTWYRKLYLLISRYISINTLKELKVPANQTKSN